ncbi:MAG: pyridoxal phosphate-dependent aminotransferase [Eubacterium sp.]|nr:pyridoxal phosphate-dependent aminotransferase [Eubacterium sp.]MDD7209068.1 pyridoxal phosphate-dependent aminotransferase [Lachnospiraceae bacterium]MDY5496418.1 MalY/PatB family protein [Anaerobutyricum sp.]
MNFDFDTVIDRKGTNSVKFDFAAQNGMPEDVLPMWVADMDFKTSPAIIEKMHEKVEYGIFGYSEGKEDYFRALSSWYRNHFGWEVKKEWLVKTPGVVFAVAMAIRAFSHEGDGILIQPPVYYPFKNMIEKNKRTLVNNPLKLVNGHYEVDFEDFEKKIKDKENKVKIFILCNPHNPGGRVWKEWELQKMGEICMQNHVLVISDEIHSDFIWEENKHTVFASLSPEFADNSITCTSPSKTFNLAGLQISNIFIPNQKLKRALREEKLATGYEEPSVMGLVACQAAYEGGEEWLRAVKEYIWNNFLFLNEYIETNIPQIHVMKPEGTYLVWLDFRELGLSEEQKQECIINKAHLWFDTGSMFGKEGEGFERINIACPRKTLKEALTRLKEALS